MRSTLLLSLALASLPVNGGRVDPQAYRLKQAHGYTNAAKVATNGGLKVLKTDDYLKTATELVKSVAPNVTFRLVDDHYVGANGVSHANFRQTANGRDIQNADFNVNVSKLEECNMSCADSF